MILIDGSLGEGGGQILRSSLSLSMVTGESVQIVNVRANRKQPGLKPQHLTALRAAAEVCSAKVSGDALRSMQVTFSPGSIRASEYRFDVGTAGSATLVLQTILPALLTAGSASRVEVLGGTHNPWSPPFDYLKVVLAPLLARMGHRLDLALLRHGFFPAGGGRIRAVITPAAAPERLELTERGEVRRTQATALVSQLPRSIAERELDVVGQRLGWTRTRVEEVDAAGPGNICLCEVECEHLTELFIGFGQRGKPAERVAADAVREVRNYLRSGAPAGEHLADQLLVPLAVAGGGCFDTTALSTHTQTNLQVIERFLGPRFLTEQRDKGRWHVASLS